MSSVGELGVVLLLLGPRSLSLGGVELGEVSFVAERGRRKRRNESQFEITDESGIGEEVKKSTN